jgi:hypothetical protein
MTHIFHRSEIEVVVVASKDDLEDLSVKFNGGLKGLKEVLAPEE